MRSFVSEEFDPSERGECDTEFYRKYLDTEAEKSEVDAMSRLSLGLEDTTCITDLRHKLFAGLLLLSLSHILKEKQRIAGYGLNA